jgi:hypothetical protein
MSRAKHRGIIEQREYESFVDKCDRAQAHTELLKQHKEFKKSQVKKVKTGE